MKKASVIKRDLVRRWMFAALGFFLLAAPSFPQCEPDDNGYVFLHPAFANRNWGKATYDSVTITIPDALCSAKPAQYDICGPAASAVAMFTNGAGGLYLMATQYECPQPKPLCTSCYLDYFDPSAVALPGITLAPNTPLYLVKNAVYGGDSVKFLVKTNQKDVLAVTLSTSTLSPLHTDTLKPANLLPGQEVFRIQGAHDSSARTDTAVMLLGSNGLLRYFRIGTGAWAETNLDLGTGVTDTVLCVSGGFAGTSSGAIYKWLGGHYTYDNAPVTKAITFISARGAAGRQGTFVDRVGTSWVSRPVGTANYRAANFINRWDGLGVELLDDQWNRTAVTYRKNASSIAGSIPSDLKDSVNKSGYLYQDAGSPLNATIVLADIDGSYNDVTITLARGGVTYNLMSDGKYTIGSLPPDSECMIDSLRLKSGVISLNLNPSQVRVAAQCELCQRDLSCSVFRCMRTDYSFSTSHAWTAGTTEHDTLTIRAGTDILRIINRSESTVADLPFGRPGDAGGSIRHRLQGGALIFFIKQAPADRLVRVSLYTVAGRILETQPVGNNASIAFHNVGASGIVFAKFLFADGAAVSKSIPLLR
jgi:hypothetical protein